MSDGLLSTTETLEVTVKPQGTPLSPVTAWQMRDVEAFPASTAVALYSAFFVMYLSPKLAGLIDAMLTRAGPVLFGDSRDVLETYRLFAHDPSWEARLV